MGATSSALSVSPNVINRRRQPGSPDGTTDALEEYYHELLKRFGRQGWWPARTRLEVIVGTILTQNTSWRNAALALKKLRKQGLLRFERLRAASPAELELSIRQAGFYRQKAETIRTFIEWLYRKYEGSLSRCFATPPAELRERLLGLKGLGPETVDAILLYAGRKPFFVADAYTRRILWRHGWLPSESSYEAAQRLLHKGLPRDSQLFNEFHALLVEAGKRYCQRRAPRCHECPLRPYFPGNALPAKSSDHVNGGNQRGVPTDTRQ